MASLLPRRAFFLPFLPFLQPKRYRGKINIQRPRPPHHEKLLFLDVAAPYYISPFKNKLPAELCKKDHNPWVKVEDNPYQRILAKECLNFIQQSRFVAFFHLNPMCGEDEYKAYAMFKKQNMHLRRYGQKTMAIAIEGTPYEAISEFYVSHNLTVFCPEPEIGKLLKITKRFRQLVLIAAIFDGKLINVDDIKKYSAIPDLKTAQAGLVSVLNSIGTHVVGQLTTHQNILVSHLQERMKQLEGS